jgi:hypothetical protein
MDRIIAGRFATKATADAVAATLFAYTAQKDICIFHNNPPGQHDVLPLGGDERVDPGAQGGAETAIGTALAAGIAAGAVGLAGGPVVALAAAGVGAYAGSLVGALNGLGDAEPQPHPPRRRPAGIILAVRVDLPAGEGQVVSDLQKGGAVDIERANGHWENGDWADFNPAEAPHMVAASSR